MTEPSGGSDLAALKTTAVRDGDGWILNGSKTFITNGYSADLIVVAARTSPEKGAKGITLFAVEAGMPGFERGRKLDKVGQPEADTSELFFADVRLPADERDRRGRPRLRLHDAAAGRPSGSGQRSATSPTPGRSWTRRWRTRRSGMAFGQPVGSFQANKFTLAELVTQAEVDPGLRRRLRHGAGAPHPDRGRCGQGEVVDARRCRTRSSTPASSSGAATAT